MLFQRGTIKETAILLIVMALLSLQIGCGDKGGSTPIANAGPDQNVTTGDLVILDGGSSFDADPDLLGYRWSFDSMPTGSRAILSGATDANPTFIADLDGSYVLSLVVNDGLLFSAVDTVTITANSVNSAPVADAGVNQNVATGSTVTLDGSGSSDPNNDLLIYSWSFDSVPTGSQAFLFGGTTVNPSFAADVDGDYVLSLSVNDGSLVGMSDTVIISATTENVAPVANAGQDQNVSTGATVTLDGSGSSDANDDLLIYSWSFDSAPADSNAILSDATAVNPSFTADVDGEYNLSLIVSDGVLEGMPDAVLISATTANIPPVANAGPDQNVSTGTTVILDGSASSDADNDPLDYLWSFTSVAGGSEVPLTGADTVNPSFVAVDEGTYVLNLVVNDGQLDSDFDVVMIIAAIENSAPVADAGLDQNVSTSSVVFLDGSGSSDADNDDLAYRWNFNSIPEDSSASLSSTTSINPTFTADVDGTYVINLIVNDGLLDSAVSQVSVTAATINSAPVADAGPDQEVATGSMVSLNGSGSSDADNDDLTYLWNFNSIPDGSSASLSLANSVAPTFSADVDGTYVINLIVNDGLLDSAVSQVSVTAATINSAPVADAGPTQNVATGDLVFLDGSRSSDADNDPLTYSWAVITVAGVNGVTLTGGDTVNPSFIAVDPGSYVFGLTVNDGELDSFPDSVTINSRP